VVLEQPQAQPSLFPLEEGRERAQVNSLSGGLCEQLARVPLSVAGLSAAGFCGNYKQLEPSATQQAETASPERVSAAISRESGAPLSHLPTPKPNFCRSLSHGTRIPNLSWLPFCTNVRGGGAGMLRRLLMTTVFQRFCN
jgi:hypothetical protein